MVWYFIGVNMIKQNITLQNFSSRLEKYFTLLLYSLVKINIIQRSREILYLYVVM